jgi:phage terminase large subunit GpA-like protein
LAGGGLNPLKKGFKAATKPPDRRKPWEWCEDYVEVDNTSPMPGKWRSDTSPWVREFMEVFADNRVSDIGVMCSAQSSKTQTLLNLLCWIIAQDPGPAMWVTAARDEVKQFVRDRVAPTFHQCKPVSGLIITEQVLEFTFGTMPLYFVGAGSPSKLQSKPIRWLLLDEVRNYPPGALETVLKRTRAFWNSRRVIISTAGRKNDAVHRAYLAGDQRVFHFPCPACQQMQPLKMEQLKWETSERTKPNGQWDFDLMSETIRYECVACGHELRDTPTDRKHISRSGKFIRTNPKAPKHKVSFHWNAILPPWVSWRSVVEEFIDARAAAKQGDKEPLRTFINETLGEPWDDELGVIDDYDFLEFRKAEYGFGEDWSEEIVRFFSADRQQKGGEHYWWVCRAFGLFGKSRLIAYGRANSKAELEELRKQYKCKPENSIIDSGYKASEVYRFCLQFGWKAFKGDDAEYFLISSKDPKTGKPKTIRQSWQRTFVDPGFGTKMQGRMKPIPLFRFSNPAIKDLLGDYMLGLVGEWTLPRNIGQDYLKQITAEQRVIEKDNRGFEKAKWHQLRADNHFFDCELQIKVAAVASKTIAAGTPQQIKPEDLKEAA